MRDDQEDQNIKNCRHIDLFMRFGKRACKAGFLQTVSLDKQADREH